MDAPQKERFQAWGRESLENIRRGEWWLVFVPVVLWFVGGVAEHRAEGVTRSEQITCK